MRELLRQQILELYGIDIGEDSTYHISNLSSFTIDANGHTFLFSAQQDMPREHQMARMMWAEDLKLFKDTICEPIPSSNHKLIEKISLENWNFSVSMYQSAKGHILKADEIRPMFLISAGDMLGTIHHVSQDQNESGMKFKLPSFEDHYDILKNLMWKMINPDLQTRIEGIMNKGFELTRNDETYGVCCMEYTIDSLMVDTNNIHLFDFDIASYAPFIYDVGTFFLSIARSGYLPKRSSKDLIHNNLLPWFRIGYSINKPCDSHSFDNLDAFIEMRLAFLLMGYIAQTMHAEQHDRIKTITSISKALLRGDLYEGIDKFIRIQN